MSGGIMHHLNHHLVHGQRQQRNQCCMYAWLYVCTNQLLQCYMLVVLAGVSYPPGMKLPGVPAW